MCGICGMHNLNFGAMAHPDALERMSARLTHRGPDSHGVFAYPYVQLAIRRLSIIDLQTGDQPLTNETGEIVLVFNGEIYNYRELRTRLIGNGHRFKTESDGEVIAHLYEDEGADFLQRLNGMFAIALWDDRSKRLVLARDRAGEKPLFYWQRGDTLVFGSEIKALLEYPDIRRTLDHEAIGEYFVYGYFPSPASAFQEIRKLPAAHRMIVENGKARIEPYWQLRDHLRSPSDGRWTKREEDDALEGLRSRLREAAVSRLVSDVPLGVFLSGGVDSSTLVAVMSNLSPAHIQSFSVSFAERTFNEEPFAARVARHFHTEHFVFNATDAALTEALDAVTAQLDEPLADPAILPTWLLSRFARERIKVALSGEGGDELFGGYPTYQGARLADAYQRLPKLARRAVRSAFERWLPVSSSAAPVGLFLRRFFEHAERQPAERHELWFGMFAPDDLAKLLAPEWRESCLQNRPLARPIEQALDGARFEDTIAEILYLDFRLYLEDNLLVKVDRSSMAASLELRTPFLDHRLIEFAAGLPSAAKLHHFRTKVLFKRAVAPWLPAEIVRRQKRGFSVPIARWMRTTLKARLEETFGEGKIRRQGVFNPALVRTLLGEHLAEKADHRRALWTLLAFQLWYDRWIEQA